jgi:hypothetical protein
MRHFQPLGWCNFPSRSTPGARAQFCCLIGWPCLRFFILSCFCRKAVAKTKAASRVLQGAYLIIVIGTSEGMMTKNNKKIKKFLPYGLQKGFYGVTY